MRSTSRNEATAHEPVEQRIGGPVLTVCQIEPRHPSRDVSLVFKEGPGRVIDDVETKVGTFDDLPRDKFPYEVVLVTSSHIGIDGAALINRHSEMSRCGPAPYDNAGVLLESAEQARVDVELEMPGP